MRLLRRLTAWWPGMTSSLPVPGDVEDAVRLHLAALLGPTVGVFAGVTPETLPAESVTVLRVGGRDAGLVVDEALLSVDCRSAVRPSDALQLARRVLGGLGAAAIDGRVGGLVCYSTGYTGGPYLNPDPSNTSQHRYTMTITITTRKAA